MPVLMIFVDGVGVGEWNPRTNPFTRALAPRLWALSSLLEGPVEGADVAAVPTDATLGVRGLPQSATGQTALLTGINAARLVGRHIHGFCTPALVDILRGASLFARVQRSGGTATFANAYTPEFFRGGRRFLSVTTVAAGDAGVAFRDLEDLERGEAVYHDVTNRGLRQRGYAIPEISPREAGRRLAGLAHRHDFTLYEHFQTDHAGHRRDMGRGVALIEQLGHLLEGVLETADLKELLVVLTSDHGNLEDLSTRTHTRNPVPTLLWGAGRREVARDVQTITDLAPALLRHIGGRGSHNGAGHA